MQAQILHPIKNAAYDHVGRYQQDQVNGLNDALLDKFISMADLTGDERVLDAMAGNGNLSKRIFDYCQANNIDFPELTTLEYSKVQSELSKEMLHGYPANVVWGDMLSVTNLASDETLASNSFDIVFIKSANHEIPLFQQQLLHDNIFRILKPGGKFLNLGFVFDNSIERDEFREIARVKDKLANMQTACDNRHFLTRDEYYHILNQSGFLHAYCIDKFHYSIRSSEVAKQYGKAEEIDFFSLEHQRAQIHAVEMRKNGRITFEADDSVMFCPGDLSIAVKPLST